MPNQALIRDMIRIFKENGDVALKQARNDILAATYDESVISQALKHFSIVTLHETLPVFPAFISISCKAVGGDASKTTPFGKAIVLITGAADLHDDVIDQSISKGPKATVFGKFGIDAAILAGDILLVKGLMQLNSECSKLPKKQGELIKRLVEEAVFEICKAETLETKIKGTINLALGKYYEIIQLKAVVPELTMEMGAIIGGADTNTINKLGHFGRTYGVISIFSDEFGDILDLAELKNRLKNECPPLPLIHALRDKEIKVTLETLLKTNFSMSIHEQIIDTIVNSKEVEAVVQTLISEAEKELADLKNLVNEKVWNDLRVLLRAPLEFYEEA
jgi:geranylgeranyl pyrophosphate synthase